MAFLFFDFITAAHLTFPKIFIAAAQLFILGCAEKILNQIYYIINFLICPLTEYEKFIMLFYALSAIRINFIFGVR